MCNLPYDCVSSITYNLNIYHVMLSWFLKVIVMETMSTGTHHLYLNPHSNLLIVQILEILSVTMISIMCCIYAFIVLSEI